MLGGLAMDAVSCSSSGEIRQQGCGGRGMSGDIGPSRGLAEGSEESRGVGNGGSLHRFEGLWLFPRAGQVVAMLSNRSRKVKV